MIIWAHSVYCHGFDQCKNRSFKIDSFDIKDNFNQLIDKYEM